MMSIETQRIKTINKEKIINKATKREGEKILPIHLETFYLNHKPVLQYYVSGRYFKKYAFINSDVIVKKIL